MVQFTLPANSKIKKGIKHPVKDISEKPKKIADILNKNAVHFDELGTITENELYINDKTKVTIDDLLTSNKSWLTNYMSK